MRRIHKLTPWLFTGIICLLSPMALQLALADATSDPEAKSRLSTRANDIEEQLATNPPPIFRSQMSGRSNPTDLRYVVEKPE